MHIPFKFFPSFFGNFFETSSAFFSTVEPAPVFNPSLAVFFSVARIDGANGADGADGTDGTDGTDETDGTEVTDGADGTLALPLVFISNRFLSSTVSFSSSNVCFWSSKVCFLISRICSSACGSSVARKEKWLSGLKKNPFKRKSFS